MTTPRRWASWIDDALIAPHATTAERVLGYGCGIAGATFAGVLAAAAALPILPTIVLIVLGFDLFGGVVVNAMLSGSRRFHASGPSGWRPLRFVTAHVHPLLLALILPEMPWATALVAYAGAVLATVLVIRVADPLRQPIAFASAAILIAVCTAALPPAPVVAWVLPLLIVKLLLAHLLPHPWAARSQVTSRPAALIDDRHDTTV